MRVIISILTFVTFTGFVSDSHKSDNEMKFKVEISYSPAINVETTEYRIDNYKLVVFYSLYNPGENELNHHDELTFTKFDKNRILSFLKSTDWKTTPKKLVTPVIDGYNFSVTIQMDEETFKFHISNTYNVTFDSLFRICNKLIPTKKEQNDYWIGY